MYPFDTRDVSVYFLTQTRAGIYSRVWKDHRWVKLSDLESETEQNLYEATERESFVRKLIRLCGSYTTTL